jgi:hypothetical protein
MPPRPQPVHERANQQRYDALFDSSSASASDGEWDSESDGDEEEALDLDEQVTMSELTDKRRRKVRYSYEFVSWFDFSFDFRLPTMDRFSHWRVSLLTRLSVSQGVIIADRRGGGPTTPTAPAGFGSRLLRERLSRRSIPILTR